MAQVKVNINGKEIETDDGKTILQVVREHNLDDIPTLCYEERLGQISSCFVCVVEVEGARTLAPSCSTKVTNGMVVRTNTEKAKEARRTCLELLFSDHYADCISPCAQECPAGVDIQGYLSLVQRGLFKEAIELIKERNPLPIVCGRVCVRKCEVGCRRNLLDEPVAINFLKRYAAESREGRLYRPETKPKKGKSVAVVGGGPAGLSSAYYLAVEGYDVTVYEGMPRAGGMLRYGIPAYRLPKDLLDYEISSIEEMGVKILNNQRLGRDFTLTSLKEEHDAVLLAMGAWGASSMRVENEDTPGVLSGLDVLRQVAEGKLEKLHGRVCVVGGGNTAIDCSRTSVRMNADETVVLYRRTEAQMPAHHEEVEGARHEGVKFKFLVSPKKVVTDENGRLKGLECIKMELGPPDKSGRPRPVPIEGSNYIEPCDFAIAAIGQKADLKCLEQGEGCDLELNRWGTIEVDQKTMETSIPGVFSAGDVVTGAATVIEGIAGGRRAAMAIHKNLSGKPVDLKMKEFVVRKDMFRELDKEEFECFGCTPRHEMPERPGEERVVDFKEVELGLSRQDTVEEVDRCFECGCLEVDECLLRKYGEDYGVNPAHYLGEVNRYEVDRRHPFVQIDPNKCIQCGRCIKTCESILGSSALGFVNRGFKTIVAPAMEKPLAETNCIACGNCIDTCPTGALSENQPLLARIGDGVVDNPAVCSFCSVGCKINVKEFGRDMRIRSLRDKLSGYGDYLCRRGRFGSRYLNEEDRILQPAYRHRGRMHYSEWDNVLERMKERLDEIKKTHGPDSVAVFISPKLTNEEIYAAVRFARGAIGTDLVGSYPELLHGRSCHEADAMTGHTVSTATMNDIPDADVILLVNADPWETHPSLGWRLGEAVRNGAKLVVVNSNRISAIRDADVWLQPRRGANTHVLNGIMHHIIKKGRHDAAFINSRTEGFDGFKEFIDDYDVDTVSHISGVLDRKITDAAEMLSEKGANVLAVYDYGSRIDRSSGDVEALTAFALLTGNIGKAGAGLIIAQDHSNTTGLHDMGAEPGYLPGRIPISDADQRERLTKAWNLVKMRSAGLEEDDVVEYMLSGKVKAAVIIGEDPMENPADLKYFRQMDFIAVMDIFETDATRYADVVLPLSTHIEEGGSFTRLDRKVQHFQQANQPIAGKTALQALCRLGEMLGHKMDLDDPAKAWEEIEKVNPLYASLGKDDAFWTVGSEVEASGRLYENRFATRSGKARFVKYPVQAQTYPPMENSYNAVESRFEMRMRKMEAKKIRAAVAVG